MNTDEIKVERVDPNALLVASPQASVLGSMRSTYESILIRAHLCNPGLISVGLFSRNSRVSRATSEWVCTV